ncbi:hypothetical protein RDE2_41380 [Rhodococcus sp. RDE2]|nr:hypothetical protein RDE2_41380 [Rhodococcus sp. RDE2]
MTSPDGFVPGGPNTGWGDMSEMAEEFVEHGLLGWILGLIGGAITAILGGFASVIDAIFGTVNDDYVRDLPVINDHSRSIEELREAYDQLVLQGLAIVFESNNTYYPSEDVISLDVIILGAGGGGGAGRWDVLGGSRSGGGGGGGGGEVHTSINAALLERNPDGTFAGVAITIGAPGSAGVGSEVSGSGGGDTSFGTYLTAGGGNGGQGGRNGYGGLGGIGGSGMIPGGKGGNGAPLEGLALPAQKGGDSTSAYSLNGGGGGGGGGGVNTVANSPGVGGIGGISPGGYGGAATRNGTPPSAVVATGGGGGGGAISTDLNGGAGAYPSGGGGGGYGSTTLMTNGGAGGAGRLYVIERKI